VGSSGCLDHQKEIKRVEIDIERVERNSKTFLIYSYFGTIRKWKNYIIEFLIR